MKRDDLFIAGDCFVDVETASLVDLPECGSDVYFAHPTTRVLCAVFTTDQGEYSWLEGQPVPNVVRNMVLFGYRFIAHGVTFERLAFERVLCPQHGFPMPEHWGCSMMKARFNGIPAALEHAASALGLPVEKDMQGARLMRIMCRPRGFNPDGTPRWWHLEEPAKLARLVDYCAQDTRVSRAVWRYTRHPFPADMKTYELVQRMNRRGVGIDIEFAEKAVRLAEWAIDKVNRELRIITKGSVDAASKVKQLKAWIATYGIELDSLDKRTVAVFLNQVGADIPEPVREAIGLRLEAGKSSVTKYRSMLHRANKCGRVSDSHVWYGASTGRLSSQGLQTQNFRRAIHRQARVVMDFIVKNPELFVFFTWGEPMELLSTLLRPTLRAAPGRELVGADLSQIEARVTAWLADDQDVLALFESGADLYRHTASSMFFIEVADVSDLQRQMGKVADLALGFGGGKGALHSMGAIYGVTFTDDEAALIVKLWRTAHPRHAKMWKAFEEAALAAVMNPGKTWRVAGPVDIDYGFDGTHLYCRLPSGRLLTYRDVELSSQVLPWTDREGNLVHAPLLLASGVNSVTRRYERYELSRIVLVENAVQAIACDVMFAGLDAADAADFEPVLSIHDELVCEPAPELLEDCRSQLGVLMTRPLDWAPGLPLACKTWSGPCYLKE
jgi:DNA polymerase